MASIRFGPDDRDTRGFIKTMPERTLAELLPQAPVVPPATSKPSLRIQFVVGALGIVSLVFALFFALGRQAPAPAAPTAVPTTAPIQPSTVPTVAQPTLLAYAAPDGVVLGKIEAGRAYTPTARLGMEWTQIRAEGSGLVWIHEAPDLTLPNLATPTAQPHPVVVSQPIQQAAPAPTQCARVSGGGTMVERCGTESIEALDAAARAAWQAEFNGNPVTVATTTPWR